MGYWDKRIQGASDILYKKTEAQLRAHLRQEYLAIYQSTLTEIEALLSEIETPNDLYRLDKFTQIKNSLARKLTALGMTEQELFGDTFTNTYHKEQALLDRLFADSKLARKDTTFLNTDSQVKQAVEGIWCADGKSWSDRIWLNKELLQERIEKGIQNSILRGAAKDEIVRDLRTTFNVGFNNADRIARTELAHVQNAAAQDRYAEAGIQYATVLTADDDRTCDQCAALEGQRFRLGEQVLPHHPGCRCCLIPVFDE